MEEKKAKDLAITIASNIILFMSNYGLLKHNQLYDVYHDMDSGKTEQVLTKESTAMIAGISEKIYTILINYEQ